jgi:D-xylose transport system ATP-binding protein
MSNEQKRKVVLSVRGITKTFGSVVALRDVSMDIYENEIVGLVGDNGAGKSTLIKIVSGNFTPDSGYFEIDGRRVSFRSPFEARQIGIETVYQDLSLCNNLDSISNLFVGRELYRNYVGLKILQNKEMERKTIQTLDTIDIQIPSVRERVEYLSGGQRQAVSLARFVAWGKKLLLLDEATAALGVRETRKALDLVARIQKEKGITIILISHNLQSIFEIVDRIIVLRLGEVMGVREKKNTTPDEIVSLITGAIFVPDQKRKEEHG